MKRHISFLLLCACFLAACAPASEQTSQPAAPVTLTIVSSYGGDDSNRGNFLAALRSYEQASGNIVLDASEPSSEEWKAKVMADFETGSEPDVLFFFTGADVNRLIEHQKFVSLDEICALFPSYASNIKEEWMQPSAYDGKAYAVPAIGYWEALFADKTVLSACGLSVPDANTTWDEFLAMCETVKQGGYVPIAASLQEIPHYWFEYTLLNQDYQAGHGNLPQTSSDATAALWQQGFADLQELYQRGYFPPDTLLAGNADTSLLLAEHKAAFLLEGSWQLGWFEQNCDSVDNYTVTYVPGKNGRAASDIIGGVSMGYYITRKAWNNPAKRAAVVELVSTLTSDAVVAKFGGHTSTVLKTPPEPPLGMNSLQSAAMELNASATSVTPSVQDGFLPAARADLFANVKNIVSGTLAPQQAIAQFMALQDGTEPPEQFESAAQQTGGN